MAGENEAKFAVSLEDKTSGAAASAADALEKLRGSIKRDTQELAAMQSAMKRLQSGTHVNVAAFKELQGRIDAQKNKIAEAEGKFVSLGGRFSQTGAKTKGASDRMKEFGDKMKGLPGPLGKAGGGLSDLAGKMTTGRMVALGAIAIFVALGVAIVALGAKIAAYGLAAGNARRNEELHFEAISRMRRGFIGARESAEHVMSAVDQVAGSTATSREQVARFAEILQRGGVRGANFSTALRAASIKAAALGDDAGAAFASMAVGAGRAGASINRLAEDVQARFGGVAARRLLSLEVITGKLKENFDALFAGINLEPLLKVFHEVIGFFSQSTATGRALKAILTTIFQPMVDSAGEGAPILKRFFQGMIIAALRTMIVFLEVRNGLRDVFGRGNRNQVDQMRGALDAGKVVVYGLAAAFGALALAAGVALLEIAAPFLLIGAVVYGAYRLAQGARRVWEEFKVQWRNGGSQMVDGLIAGIRAGIERAKNAVRELGRNVIDEWRSILDIHSPSRVFAGLGRQIPAGVAVGVDAGADQANASVADMLSIPETIGGGVARGAVSVSFGDIHVSGSNAAEVAENLRDEVARLFEGLAMTMGGARV